MKTLLAGVMALACAGVAGAQSTDDTWALNGKLRAQWDGRNAADMGPLAQANVLQSGTAALPTRGATAQTELLLRGRNWNAIVTAQQQAWDGQGGQGTSWVNELVLSHDAGSWQYSAGKKIVGWDVGYAFRPNDMVQQEARRSLVSSTAEGRPVLMAEHFDAERSWSFVAVNPSGTRDQTGATEPALAARFYQRQAAVDWHGFVRVAERTGSSVGAALAWVASDAVELHASARYLQRADSLVMTSSAAPLQTSNPWQRSSVSNPALALVGGTWTHQSQLSVLLEAWWDGTALSPQQWSDWRQRNQSLDLLASRGAPTAAVAGNLAWQADAFSASSSLQRSNVYARLSWDVDAWQPSLDLLYHPADGGRMVTAALLWKGDRVQVQGGVRVNAGPDDAVLVQLPTRRQAYLLASWAF
jgi:hypothetical protein